MMNAQSAGRHTVAEFRQKWIDKVIDALCEHHAISMTITRDGPLLLEDGRKLASLRTRLEILLNPEEEDTVELLDAIAEVAQAATPEERIASSPEVVRVARRLLKKEWVRIKSELE
jgi:hypothetical protein